MVVFLARLVFQLLAVYAVVLLLVYVCQRSLQYFPDKNHPGDPKESAAPSMREVELRTEDGLTLNAWFAAPVKRDGKIVVMYHGNAGHIGHRAVKAQHFIDKGMGVLLVEYRGFGGNIGSPSEQGLYKDGRAALSFLEKQEYANAQLVIYGESIGSGVATQMAYEIQPRYLILEAPFSSAAAVAKKRYFFLPVDWLMKDRFDNIDKIGGIKTNLLIVHGDEDSVIPIELAQMLYEQANHPKEFITINGGHHNDLYDHHAGHVVTEWLEKQIAAEEPAVKPEE
ncbi:MAG TPA: alpha/beta hydrolase [Alphaproteobacteria bacterium]|nr:alpha/beta hydrolase [Alphaproteobacteria bacterium]